jgi:hypothetical protein
VQYDSILHSSFNQEALINFYASLPVSWLPELCMLAWNLASVFGSTHTCQQASFTYETKIIKVSFNNHRHDISKIEPIVNSLAEQTQAQVSY